jgi:hypothetical protein
MFFNSKKNRRVETLDASAEEPTKEASEKDLEEKEEEDTVEEEYLLPILTMAR